MVGIVVRIWCRGGRYNTANSRAAAPGVLQMFWKPADRRLWLSLLQLKPVSAALWPDGLPAPQLYILYIFVYFCTCLYIFVYFVHFVYVASFCTGLWDGIVWRGGWGASGPMRRYVPLVWFWRGGWEASGPMRRYVPLVWF